MNFWNNSRYDAFESNTSGDIMRGLPKNDFPWKLKQIKFQDPDGDIWSVELSVTNIVPTKFTNDVQIEFKCLADTKISEKRLEGFGFASDRLKALSLGQIGCFQYNTETQVESPLDKLEEQGEKVLKLFIKNLIQKYNNEKKLNLLKEQTHSGVLSRFNSSLHS